MHHVLPSPPAVPTSVLIAHEAEQPPTEDVREDVVHAAAAAAPFPKPLLSIAVVQLALLRVGQHFVRKTYFFELQKASKEDNWISEQESWGRLQEPRIHSVLEAASCLSLGSAPVYHPALSGMSHSCYKTTRS